MRDTIGATVARFVLVLVPTAPFLGVEAFYLALGGTLLPRVLRLGRS